MDTSILYSWVIQGIFLGFGTALGTIIGNLLLNKFVLNHLKRIEKSLKGLEEKEKRD